MGKARWCLMGYTCTIIQLDGGDGYSASRLQRKMIEAYKTLNRLRLDLRRLEHHRQENMAFQAMLSLELVGDELFDFQEALGDD